MAVAALLLAGLLLCYLALRKKGPPSSPLIPAGGFGVTTDSLPPAKEGWPYRAALSAAGGKPPYSWAAEQIPYWLRLEPTTGGLYGVPPKGSAGTYDVYVYVADSEGRKSILKLLYVSVNA